MGSIAQVRLILHEITEAKQLPRTRPFDTREHTRERRRAAGSTHAEAARAYYLRVVAGTATLKKHSHHRQPTELGAVCVAQSFR